MLISKAKWIGLVFTDVSNLGLPDSAKREFCIETIGMRCRGSLPSCIMQAIINKFPDEDMH